MVKFGVSNPIYLMNHPSNPFLNLNYEPAIEALGDYHDIVTAAEYPMHKLRWRNDDLLPAIALEPSQVTDDDFIEAFGHFQSVRPFLALRYHGYQFGEYNPQLGDGRGFVYGQVRGLNDELYDFGTKGSGRTPYSRSADGKLTLKGGVREIIASEALHRMGVKTSRCLSLIETGEDLWRGDEPSPTRSAVMVRFSRSHIRFGTFERLRWLSRADLVRKLLDHVLQIYYPHIWEKVGEKEYQDGLFYLELVERVATLCAQWMAAGFCHAVLNTDNMSITGESFDYGPFAFIPSYDPRFTAAYFDHAGRYSYANQPAACYWNLEKLQDPLSLVMDKDEMQLSLQKFKDFYRTAYCETMLKRLGFTSLSEPETEDLIGATLELLAIAQAIGYNQFFVKLRESFHPNWRENPNNIFENHDWELTDEQENLLDKWKVVYHQLLIRLPIAEMANIAEQLKQANPIMIFLRPKIEELWERITVNDDWQPLYEAIAQLKN